MAKEILNNQESVNLIKETNAEDIKVYDYVRAELFPKQVANYGPNFDSDHRTLQQENRSFKSKEPISGKALRRLFKLLLPVLSRGSDEK